LIRVALLELVGYREWTESIGDDREWLLQKTQSLLYAAVQDAAARKMGFVMPLRYDYMLVLASNLSREDLGEILEAAREASPVPVRMASTCRFTPVGAVESSWSLLARTEPGTLNYESCGDRESIIVAHLDINDITSMTSKVGVLRTYNAMLGLVSRIAQEAYNMGAIAQYLGGDNILAVLPEKGHRVVAERLASLDDLKAGIGAAATPRRALELAAKALHAIRVGAVSERIYEIKDPVDTR